MMDEQQIETNFIYKSEIEKMLMMVDDNDDSRPRGLPTYGAR